MLPEGDSMATRHITSLPGVPAAHSPFSHAVVANGFVFVSGQVGLPPGAGMADLAGMDVKAQTRQAVKNVGAILEAAGSSLDKVVKVTVLLARPETFKEMNEAYAECFPGPKPARAVAKLGVELPNVLVSIEAVATTT
jgi:2-iminobutanoate/2-iminopropanoate deaminase